MMTQTDQIREAKSPVVSGEGSKGDGAKPQAAGAAAERPLPPGAIRVEQGEEAPAFVPRNFWQQPWVQEVLPFVTSLAVHATIIVIGLLIFGVYKAVSAPPHQDQVIIPESTMATEGPPGGVPNEGAGNNPLQQAMQDKDPNAGAADGFAEKKGPTVDLTNTGATGDSNDAVIGVGPGGGFNKGKGLLGDAAGGGDSSGALAPFGVPGGGGLGPKGPVFGNGGNARTIAFVCDASGSMLAKMPALKAELSKVVHNNLKPIQAFNVLFFSSQGKPVAALSRESLIFATPDNKRRFDDFIGTISTTGDTDPIPGIEMAFRQHPQLIYLLTDGEFPANDAVLARIRALNADKKAKINTIAFTNSDDIKNHVDVAFKKFLKQVADENGGTFKDVNADDLD